MGRIKMNGTSKSRRELNVELLPLRNTTHIQSLLDAMTPLRALNILSTPSHFCLSPLFDKSPIASKNLPHE
jgi:hypothetical protein